MYIYTSNPDNHKGFDICRDNGIGITLAPRYKMSISPRLKEFRVFLDNGAWRAYVEQSLWDEYAFLKLISRVLDLGIKPDFIVTPDIVAGGLRSLFKSLRWTERLEGNIPLALAVQDGMQIGHIAGYRDRFAVIFVGGSEAWKWDTAASWIQWGHDNGKLVHIGRAGTIEKLQEAERLGADSIDSSSFVRNNSWENIERLRDNRQLTII